MYRPEEGQVVTIYPHTEVWL